MADLSFADLIESRVPLTAAEAVELTLAVARVLDTRRLTDAVLQVPGDERILLHRAGQVTFTTVSGSTDSDEISALAGLTRRLLQLDDPDAPDKRRLVPGGLLILLARAFRQMDLPPPGRDEFRAGLARFAVEGTPSAATLAAIFSRAAGLRRATDEQQPVFERLPAPATAAGWTPGVDGPRAAVAGALVGAALVATVAGSGMLDRVLDGAGPVVSAGSVVPGRAPGAAPAARAVPLVTRVATLLDDGAANHHVTISPDGTMIAFDSDRDGTRGVFVAKADGQDVRRISGSGHASVPSWSPDGRRIAFVKPESDNARVWNVWLAPANGGELQRVTAHALGQPWGASWFPDGRRLAYGREQELVILDLQTGRSTIIASPRRDHLVRTPAASPDGSRVVFQVQGDGAWMLELPRMMLRRILLDPSAEHFVWAPNGRAIAYHARSGDGWGLWMMEM